MKNDEQLIPLLTLSSYSQIKHSERENSEAMVDAVVSIAVVQLGKFISENVSFMSVIMSNMKWLRQELEYMLSFLKDAEEMQEGDHRVRQWVTDITDIANDTVSVLENITLEERGGCLERLRYYACVIVCRKKGNIFNLGMQIESIKERVVDVSRRRETYGIGNVGIGITTANGQNNGSAVKALRRSTSYMDSGQIFVGFEDAKRKILHELLKEESRRCMVSIHGLGGLGKTSLARNLYNSFEVHSRFPSRAWICVSQEYSIPDLLRSFVKSFKKGCGYEELMMLEKMNVDDLERYIREMLKDRRYLVVVDDVWDREAWECLKRAFPDYGNGSRVIVTTRNKDLAIRMDDRIYAHHLRFLNPQESWELFCRKLSYAQERAERCFAGMEDLAKEMVAKCGGLPLALVVLGGLLGHKQSLEEWQMVKQHIWRHLAHDSIEITHLLSLSYNDLPRNLKQCFLYLGMFPEDYLIDTKQLTCLWMAEGFVLPGEEMEEVAESYLNELFNRSLLQVAQVEWERIAKCRIHDLLRDLAMKKAFEVDFYEIYDHGVKSPSIQRRRHAVHSQTQRYISSDNFNTKLRSLVVLNRDHERNEMPELFVAIGKYNHLCVLKLEGVALSNKLPGVIGHLIQLKLFGLSYSGTVVLPSSIGNLKSLQTLEAISIDGFPCRLPQETSKLTNLRHLMCRITGNAEIGALFNLRTLKTIAYKHWAAIKTENLTNLRELVIKQIKKEGKKDYTLGSISKLKKLDTLVLSCVTEERFPSLDFLSYCQDLRKLVLSGKIKMLPAIENWPESIIGLNLARSQLEEDPIPMLGRLPRLRRLELNESHKSATMFFHDGSFPQLEILRLYSLFHLKKMKLGKEALPKIKCLYISKCFQLEEIPEELKSILIRSDREYELFEVWQYSPRSSPSIHHGP